MANNNGGGDDADNADDFCQTYQGNSSGAMPVDLAAATILQTNCIMSTNVIVSCRRL